RLRNASRRPRPAMACGDEPSALMEAVVATTISEEIHADTRRIEHGRSRDDHELRRSRDHRRTWDDDNGRCYDSRRRDNNGRGDNNGWRRHTDIDSNSDLHCIPPRRTYRGKAEECS